LEDQKFKKQYSMFDLEMLDKDVWYWKNTISYPEELINFINNLDLNPESYSKIPKWQIWNSSNHPDHVYGAYKMISSDSVNIVSSDKKTNQINLYVVNSLSLAAKMCVSQYLKGHNLDESKYKLDLTYVPIRKWDVGLGMGPHSDNVYEFPNLAFTTVTYLNDNYEGGEIEFPDLNIKVKPELGSTIMFPGTVIHKVNPILSGVRYMSTNSINMV